MKVHTVDTKTNNYYSLSLLLIKLLNGSQHKED